MVRVCVFMVWCKTRGIQAQTSGCSMRQKRGRKAEARIKNREVSQQGVRAKSQHVSPSEKGSIRSVTGESKSKATSNVKRGSMLKNREIKERKQERKQENKANLTTWKLWNKIRENWGKKKDNNPALKQHVLKCWTEQQGMLDWLWIITVCVCVY